eukprot:g31570.t1
MSMRAGLGSSHGSKADHGAPDVRELQRCLAEARALRETLAAPRAILRDARQSLEAPSARLLQHVEECSSPAGKAELAELRRSSRQERAELQAAIGAAAGGLPLEDSDVPEFFGGLPICGFHYKRKTPPKSKPRRS